MLRAVRVLRPLSNVPTLWLYIAETCPPSVYVFIKYYDRSYTIDYNTISILCIAYSFVDLITLGKLGIDWTAFGLK